MSSNIGQWYCINHLFPTSHHFTCYEFSAIGSDLVNPRSYKMEKDNPSKMTMGWDEPLGNIGKERAKRRKQKYSDRPPSPGNPSSRKRRYNHDAPYAETSPAAVSAVNHQSRRPPDLHSLQPTAQVGEPLFDLATPSFDLYSHRSQASNYHMASPGHPSATSAALTYPHGGESRTGLPYTYSGMITGCHDFRQATRDAPHLAYDPAASAPFNHSLYAYMPPDYSRSGLYPQFDNHSCVPKVLQHSDIGGNATHGALRSSAPPIAPYEVQTSVGASAPTHAPQFAVIDPDPFLYIDSLHGYHLRNERSPGENTVRTAYFHGREKRPTILAMRLAPFKDDDFRFATVCVHYRNHTPGEWEAFKQPDRGSSPRDHPSERKTCFLTELEIEKRLPSPQMLKRVWTNSYNLALSEQSSKVPNDLLPPKDDMTDWDVPKRAFQLTAGYIEYHLQGANPRSQMATIRLCDTAETFDKLRVDRVSVIDSLIRPPRLSRDHVTVLTNRHWPVTDSVPNLTVGSVDLTNA